MSASRPFAYLFERFPSFVQTFCYREVEEMVRQGMRPMVVSIRHPEDPPELVEPMAADVFDLPEEKLLRAEVDRRRPEFSRRIRRALSRHRSQPDSQRLFEAAWLGPALRQRGVRHVHAHFGGLAARTAWWLRRLHGITYSFTGHANDIFCENPFPVTNADLVAQATFIVTETDFARAWMEQRYPAARGKIHRVYNGLDPAGFPPRQPAGPPPRLLSVGRYVEKKGFGDLIEACRLLQTQGHEFACQIIGGGPLEAELQTRIAAAGVGGRVQLLGPQPQDEVRARLAGAAAFVLACVPEAGGGSDNLPTVIVEAMMAGVPVVSTHLAGVPEMITSGQDGLLISPGAPGELAAELARLLVSPALAEKLGSAGRESARARFAIAGTTASLKRLLISRADVVPPPVALALEPGLAALLPSQWARWWRRITMWLRTR